MKYKLLILFACFGLSAFAISEPQVEVVITPSEKSKVGCIEINISNIESKNYDRLILLYLPIEISPTIPVGNSHKFSGCWHIDDKQNKAQLWLGNILMASKTDLQMQTELPNMMRESDNINHSYKLKINPNHPDGFHNFLRSTDSIEVVYVNKIVFKGNKSYPIKETFPDGQWEKEDENVCKYIISNQNITNSAYIIFGVPNISNLIEYIIKVLGLLVAGFLASFGICKQYDSKKNIPITILLSTLAFILIIVFILVVFKNNEFDYIVFDLIASIVGAVGGFVVGINNKKKDE